MFLEVLKTKVDGAMYNSSPAENKDVCNQTWHTDPAITCLAECATIEEQTHSDIYLYTGSMEPEEAQVALKKLVKGAEEDRQWLSKTVESRGDDVLSLWTRKTINQRRSIIHKACPDIEDGAFPYLRALFDKSEWPARRRLYRNGLLLPYLNTDTLLGHEDNLLGLAHNRAAYSLSSYARVDLELVTEAYKSGLLERQYNSGCVEIGENQDEAYGSLAKFACLFPTSGHILRPLTEHKCR